MNSAKTITITTAIELDTAHCKKIVAAVEKKLKCSFSSVKTVVNDGIIGGIKITIDNTEYDGSIKGKLDKVYQQMRKNS